MIKMDWKTYAIGTLTLAILVLAGIEVSPDDTHFCRDLAVSKNCDHLSSTGKTCYPYNFTTQGKKLCSSGWEEILRVQPKVEQELVANQLKYLCNQKECIPKT